MTPLRVLKLKSVLPHMDVVQPQNRTPEWQTCFKRRIRVKSDAYHDVQPNYVDEDKV